MVVIFYLVWLNVHFKPFNTQPMFGTTLAIIAAEDQ